MSPSEKLPPPLHPYRCGESRGDGVGCGREFLAPGSDANVPHRRYGLCAECYAAWLASQRKGAA